MAETSLQVASQTAAIRQSFEPTTLQEAIEFSKMIADSELLPKDFRGKPANILVALQIGKELNIPPLQALQGIYVVNGRGVVWGDLMWAIITSHREFEDSIEEVTDTQAKVTLKRRGRSPVTVTFTQADAVKAGLWTKQGPWTQYPKRQMLWRARTFAARDLFPDALKGLTSAEEASDYQVIEGQSQAPTSSAPTSAPATEQKTEEVIGQSGGSAYYKLYSSNGWTADDSRAFLRDNLQIGEPHNKKDSRDIPKSEWTEDLKTGGKAFEWANSPAPIKKAVEEKFESLGFTAAERDQFFAQHKGPKKVEEFANVAKALDEEIDRRNKQERGE